MLKRLRVVGLSHITRRLLWLAGALYIALLAVGVLGAITLPHDRSALEIVDPWPPLAAGWDVALSESQTGRPRFNKSIRAVNFISTTLSAADVQQLARCESLEWLTLRNTKLADLDNLDWLANLNHLTTLYLGFVHRKDGTQIKATLPPLPALRTLVLTPVVHSVSDVIASVQHSPNVEEVVIKGPSDGPLDDATVDSLARMPALRRLFVGGYVDDPQFAKLQSRLPQAQVWHTDMRSSRMLGASWCSVSREMRELAS